MLKRSSAQDYETVTRSSSRRSGQSNAVERSRPNSKIECAASVVPTPVGASLDSAKTFLKHGHVLSFAVLFLFTIVLYGRPAEFYPSPFTNSIALVIGVITLATFLATQFSLESSLTTRTSEVNLVLLLMLTGLLSIPLAIDPAIAWQEFSGTFVRGILIFIVIVNVVRTEARLKGLLFLAVVTAIALSAGAINEYRLGVMLTEGYRVSGRGAGLFGNTNDMALHLVTIMPISVAFFFGSRGAPRKILHAACAVIMIAGILLSYSRGAFLGMLVAFVFFALKIGKRSRFEVAAVFLALFGAILLLAPSGYGTRLLSIFIPGLDAEGSADSRRGELLRSLYVALRHPLLGIGMGNYQPNMSYRGLVTHNSYTQVASEMGATAVALYTMFLVKPLRKVSVIVRETFGVKEKSNFYYLALGLQASLLVYMVSSFFLSVAYTWNVYYLVGYAVCFRRIYESDTGESVVVEKRKRGRIDEAAAPLVDAEQHVAAA